MSLTFTRLATGAHEARVDDTRTFTIERPWNARRWSLWYGAPGRRLFLGDFASVVEAKIIAEDAWEQITRNNRILGENHA